MKKYDLELNKCPYFKRNSQKYNPNMEMKPNKAYFKRAMNVCN